MTVGTGESWDGKLFEHGLFHVGDTVISAQATGPAEVKLQKEIMDKATIEVIFRTKSSGTGGEQKRRSDSHSSF